jgi:hypothetical protein
MSGWAEHTVSLKARIYTKNNFNSIDPEKKRPLA